MGVAGYKPDLVRLDAEPVADDLGEARLVALTRGHCSQYELNDARRIDRHFGAFARRAGVQLN